MIKWQGKEKQLQVLKLRGIGDSLGPPIGNTTFLFEAFAELASERINGKIPITKIFEYADRYGLGEQFVQDLKRIDDYFVRKSVESAEKSPKQTRTASGAKPGGSGAGRTSDRRDIPGRHSGVEYRADPVGAEGGGGRRER